MGLSLAVTSCDKGDDLIEDVTTETPDVPEEPIDYYIQTENDIAIEKKLDGTAWRLSRTLSYFSDGRVFELKNVDVEQWDFYFTLNQPEDAEYDFDHQYREYWWLNFHDYGVWRVFSDGVISFNSNFGKVISLTDDELVISTHQQQFFDNVAIEYGEIKYFKNVTHMYRAPE